MGGLSVEQVPVDLPSIYGKGQRVGPFCRAGTCRYTDYINSKPAK